MKKTAKPKKERNRMAILAALRRHNGPLSSSELAARLRETGLDLSERTLRLYLSELDAEGLTEARGRRGRVITAKGMAEGHAAATLERVGYFSARIDRMIYRMSFDLPTRSGEVVVNTSLISPERLLAATDEICRVMELGYAMGNRLALLGPGEKLNDLTVPPGNVGLCTVCSITLNGVLLKHGVPTASRFGGLLELRNHKPERFVEMINYGGTSVDPLETFIRAGMTDYRGAIRDGDGLIGASFRELPEDGRSLVIHLAAELEMAGLGALMLIGQPSQPLLGVPVSEGRIGAVMVGGLNPVAILEESGIRVHSRAMAGLLEFDRLFHYDELARRLRALM